MNLKQSYKELHVKFKSAKLVIMPVDPMNMDGKISGQIKLISANTKEDCATDIYPVKTPSGRFAFYEISDSSNLIRINGTYYINKNFLVTLPDDLPEVGTVKIIDEECTFTNNGGVLTATIHLIPSPDYLLSAGSTIIRIRVITLDSMIESPVENAKIYAKFENKGTEQRIYVTRSDSNGQAIVCCNRMTREKIIQMNGFSFDGPKAFSLLAVDPVSGAEGLAFINIKEFWQNFVDIALSV
jgi:hypothetical protein